MLNASEADPPALEMSVKGIPLQPFVWLAELWLVPAAAGSQVMGSAVPVMALPAGSQPAATGPTTPPLHGDVAPVAVPKPSAPWKSTAGTPSLPKPSWTSCASQGCVVSIGFEERAKSTVDGAVPPLTSPPPKGAVSLPHNCF